MNRVADTSRREQRALTTSMLASVALGLVALVWGVLAQSQVLVLDGVYVLLGLALSWLSLVASRLVAQGPTAEYPFGREPLVPLVVGVQGAALAGTFIYAVFEAVRVIISGGSDVAPGMLLIYGILSGVTALATWLVLRRICDSDLVRAEATSWIAGATGSLVIVIGSVAVVLLETAGVHTLSPYVDSVLVIVTSLLLAPIPVRMLRQSIRELVGAAPARELDAAVRDVVERVRAAEELPAPVLRTRKVAGVLFVEVGFVVSDDWAVSDEDRVRRAVVEGLAPLPIEPWVVVEISTDEELIA